MSKLMKDYRLFNLFLKKAGMFSLLLMFCFVVNAQRYSHYLYVEAPFAADDKEYPLSAIRKITFANNNMEVELSKSSNVTTIPFSKIEEILFGVSESTSMKEEMSADVMINYIPSSQEITIVSPDALKLVNVYNMRGALIISQIPGATNVAISMQNYPSGVYIVQAAGGESVITKKIVK